METAAEAAGFGSVANRCAPAQILILSRVRRLILMLKFPVPGAVKTRLAPALGEQRACALHRALVAQTLAEVARFANGGEVAVEARIAGAPDETAARAWLESVPMHSAPGVTGVPPVGAQGLPTPPALTIRNQGDGDLGARMERAVAAAFTEGAEAVVVIGGDCPQLTAEHLASAFATLARAEVVLGPAADGGYYLIGMRRMVPALFHGIRWGSDEVFAQTLSAARAVAVEVAQLATLRDVDVPDDLAVWAETPAARVAGRGRVSGIVAALNEESHLPATLAAAQRGTPHEIIVVDGGSTDRTLATARAHDAIVLAAPAGRARQMNHGAAAATGEFLLFLHADTILPADYAALVCATLAQPGVAGGAFEFAIAGEFAGRRLIERGTNWRARRRQLPYGDQGIFVRRETFFQAGGFPDLPIMEDCEFVRRLRGIGRVAIAPAAALTSGRRWQRLGALRTTLINQLVILGYRLGVSPARLARWYHRARGLPAPATATGAHKAPSPTFPSPG
jgi:rSAM/selenodomain-associated transferase 2